MAAPNVITGENTKIVPEGTTYAGIVTLTTAAGTDTATVITEIAELRAALVALGLCQED